MPLDRINVKIYPLLEELFQGGGFYQVEESTLQVITSPIKTNNHFFSYLECENFRIDINQNGSIIFIESHLPKKRWTITKNLTFPSNAKIADIRILDFRKSIAVPKLLTNNENTLLKIEWVKEHNVSHYLTASDILLEVDNNSQLTSIWINNITDDLAGQSIAKLRSNYFNLE